VVIYTKTIRKFFCVLKIHKKYLQRVIMIYKHDRSYYDAKKCIAFLTTITAVKRVIWNMH